MVREPVALFQNSCVVAAAVATPHLHRKKKDEEEQETPFRNSWMAAAAEATSYLCRIKKHVEEQLEEEEEKEEEHHHHHHHYQQQQEEEEEEAVVVMIATPVERVTAAKAVRRRCWGRGLVSRQERRCRQRRLISTPHGSGTN
jgi:flavin-dependent dehydrogenase